jgi:hypothetical protein
MEMSPPRLCPNAYCTSSATLVAYDTSLRPDTCHSPVIPGRADSTMGMYWPYRRISSSVIGRGPTRLISPRNTFTSCGSSSSEVRRSRRPRRVTRGSFLSLKVSANSSASAGSEASSSARRASASTTIVRSFRQPIGRPERPTRS